MRRLGLALAAIVALCGCKGTETCKPGTAFVSFTFAGAAVNADGLQIQTCVDGQCGAPSPVPHTMGATTGSLEVDFSHYTPGSQLQVTATATATMGTVILSAPATNTVPLLAGCTTMSLTVGTASDAGADAIVSDANVSDSTSDEGVGGQGGASPSGGGGSSAAGATGSAGANGAAGAMGSAGATGAAGAPGDAGAAGGAGSGGMTGTAGVGTAGAGAAGAGGHPPLQVISFATSPAGMFMPPVTSQGQFARAAIALGDVNGDGKPDLAFGFEPAGVNSTNVTIYPNNGSATFFGASAFNFAPSGFAAGEMAGVALGDVDGDGKADLVMGLFMNPTAVFIFKGQGNATFASNTFGKFTSTVAGNMNVLSQSIALGDLNGDGKPDLAQGFGSTTSSNVVFFPNEGGTTGFASSPSGIFAPTSAASGASQSIALGDVDGDGKLDLALETNGLAGGGASGFQVSIFLGTGTGTIFKPMSAFSFTPSIPSASGAAKMSIALGDVNGDGKPDLAIGVASLNGSAGYQIALFLNTSH